MASPSASKDRSWLDCGQCGQLCVAATLLQCGHVYCRRCVIHLVQSSTPCPACGQTVAAPPGTTVSQRVQAVSQELVMQDLVTQRLAAQGLQPCDVCCNREAACHCLDCGEQYCHACSAAHRKMKMAEDHEIKSLPAVLYNDPASARAHKATAAARPLVCTDSTDCITNTPRLLPNSGLQQQTEQWTASCPCSNRLSSGQLPVPAATDGAVDSFLSLQQQTEQWTASCPCSNRPGPAATD